MNSPSNLEGEFIQQLNESLTEGIVGPKSKKVDLLQRLAVSLHVFNHIASKLLRGRVSEARRLKMLVSRLSKKLYVTWSIH